MKLFLKMMVELERVKILPKLHKSRKRRRRPCMYCKAFTKSSATELYEKL